jgi:hypothetical protein
MSDGPIWLIITIVLVLVVIFIVTPWIERGDR